MDEDIGELNNIADANPDLADELSRELKSWRDEVGAQYPSENPDFNGNANK